ncbi:hypothetical protein [Kitasatospora purpeofusca]|uniref:hypothetical protein n=1 Tax=Kitasatospora purpeofusca TaxID=67352 RepID=UPI0036B0EE84
MSPIISHAAPSAAPPPAAPSEPSELALQVVALGLAADLIRQAVEAGVPQTITPTWTMVGGFLTGHLVSDDASALVALEAWRRVIRPCRIGGRQVQAPDGPRWVCTITLTRADVSVRLTASVPAALAPRQGVTL